MAFEHLANVSFAVVDRGDGRWGVRVEGSSTTCLTATRFPSMVAWYTVPNAPEPTFLCSTNGEMLGLFSCVLAMLDSDSELRLLVSLNGPSAASKTSSAPPRSQHRCDVSPCTALGSCWHGPDRPSAPLPSTRHVSTRRRRMRCTSLPGHWWRVSSCVFVIATRAFRHSDVEPWGEKTDLDFGRSRPARCSLGGLPGCLMLCLSPCMCRGVRDVKSPNTIVARIAVPAVAPLHKNFDQSLHHPRICACKPFRSCLCALPQRQLTCMCICAC